SHVRENIADLNSVLPVFLEGERRLHQISSGELGPRSLIGKGLAVILIEQRFVIKRVDLAKPALQEDDDDVFCLGGEMRSFGRPGIAQGRGHGSEAGHAEAGGESLQRISPCKRRQTRSVSHGWSSSSSHSRTHRRSTKPAHMPARGSSSRKETR